MVGEIRAIDSNHLSQLSLTYTLARESRPLSRLADISEQIQYRAGERTAAG